MDMDQNIAERLYGYLVDRHVRLEMLTAFSPTFDAPLRWGEVIPIWYLLQKAQKSMQLCDFYVQKLIKVCSSLLCMCKIFIKTSNRSLFCIYGKFIKVCSFVICILCMIGLLWHLIAPLLMGF